MAREGTGDREFFICSIDIFKQITLFAANNSFSLRKQSSQKSLKRLLKPNF